MREVPLPLTEMMKEVPFLLMYLVGIILALVYWKRYPRPSRFTLISMGLLLLSTTITQAYLYLILNVVHGAGNLGFEQYLGFEFYLWMGWVTIVVATVLRVVALALVLAAVFMDRKVGLPRELTSSLHGRKLISHTAVEHGITSQPGS